MTMREGGDPEREVRRVALLEKLKLISETIDALPGGYQYEFPVDARHKNDDDNIVDHLETIVSFLQLALDPDLEGERHGSEPRAYVGDVRDGLREIHDVALLTPELTDIYRQLKAIADVAGEFV